MAGPSARRARDSRRDAGATILFLAGCGSAIGWRAAWVVDELHFLRGSGSEQAWLAHANGKAAHDADQFSIPPVLAELLSIWVSWNFDFRWPPHASLVTQMAKEGSHAEGVLNLEGFERPRVQCVRPDAGLVA